MSRHFSTRFERLLDSPPAGFERLAWRIDQRDNQSYRSTYRRGSVTIATITLSSKGQVVIPKEIREELHWDAGTELTLVSNASGVTIKAMPKKTGRNLADLIGMLKHDGPPLATEELCRPVELSDEECR